MLFTSSLGLNTANLLLYGSIVSTTDPFTHNIKALLKMLSQHNLCFGLGLLLISLLHRYTLFVLRLSKILFGLQDDGSELSGRGGESESEEESKEDNRAESKQVLFEPVISDSE